MPRKLTLQERLIVAADFKPPEEMRKLAKDDPEKRDEVAEWVGEQVLKLCQDLAGTGVYLKVNSALRFCGYKLIHLIHGFGLKVFADLKLVDIPETVSIDALLLSLYQPELVTVMANAGAKAIKALKDALPNSEILAVTILTSLDEEECDWIYGASIEESVLNLATLASNAGADGFICSPKEVPALKKFFGTSKTYNTPGIRPDWFNVKKDDQNPDRVKTPEGAIRAGATRLIIGRPILGAENRRDAVARTIGEIKMAEAT